MELPICYLLSGYLPSAIRLLVSSCEIFQLSLFGRRHCASYGLWCDASNWTAREFRAV
jgi:hypothetical protein